KDKTTDMIYPLMSKYHQQHQAEANMRILYKAVSRVGMLALSKAIAIGFRHVALDHSKHFSIK
ncbi:MAG: hypothetical protein J6S69_11885, partial [Proteobacteria bacterium]|nr:hypothetical protein [Pseudomonadota bacterium]